MTRNKPSLSDDLAKLQAQHDRDRAEIARLDAALVQARAEVARLRDALDYVRRKVDGYDVTFDVAEAIATNTLEQWTKENT